MRPLFGWKRKDGTRRYRTVYVEIPRKNGKTTLAAGLALFLLFADKEAGAEVYSAAADREQAAIAFDLAKSMVEGSPRLRGIAEVFKRSIVVPSTGSSYKVISADAHTKHGYNAHGIILDEVHAQPNRDLYDVLHTSTGARRQPVEFLITTAGVYEPQSIAWQLHEYAGKVRDGIVDDPSFLPVLYGAPMDADYRDEAVWRAANPGLGISVKLDYLAAEAKMAAEQPSYENTFRRLHLNQWTQQVTRWIKIEDWNACAGEMDLAALEGKPCYAGLDLSETTDISSLSLVFPPDEDEPRYRVLPFFWCPEERLVERSRRDRVSYDAWARDGFIHATEGDVIDYRFIRQRIVELSHTYAIQEIPFDPWNSRQIATQLGEEDGLPMVEFRQGYVSMNEPSKEFERLVVSGGILHARNPVLDWMISNVAVRRDPAGNIKPDKEKSREKIDGVVATVMGVGRAMVRTDPTSVYESRGVLVL